MCGEGQVGIWGCVLRGSCFTACCLHMVPCGSTHNPAPGKKLHEAAEFAMIVSLTWVRRGMKQFWKRALTMSASATGLCEQPSLRAMHPCA